jgi:REP element-mobilizing transposase RayT
VAEINYKEFSRRHRPHIVPLDETLFLTFRLFGSIPKATTRYYKAKYKWLLDHLRRVERLAENDISPELEQRRLQIEEFSREWFIKTEELLHACSTGPTWLKEDAVAGKVAENLHRLDGDAYRLDAFSIMSNHVHTVFKPHLSEADLFRLNNNAGLLVSNEHTFLSNIMKSVKGRSARECNLVLGRSGSFWEPESFDRVIRHGRFDKTVRYVLNNPVKAGLVSDWEEWRWNYCREELVERFRKK